MGLGLSLLPLDGKWDMEKEYATVSTCLTFEKESLLINYILKKFDVYSHTIPQPVLIQCCNPCILMKSISQDGLGKDLTYMLTNTFWPLRFPVNATRKDRAIKAFINQLPYNIPIILYWY